MPDAWDECSASRLCVKKVVVTHGCIGEQHQLLEMLMRKVLKWQVTLELLNDLPFLLPFVTLVSVSGEANTTIPLLCCFVMAFSMTLTCSYIGLVHPPGG